jgi:hypothetical protein
MPIIYYDTIKRAELGVKFIGASTQTVGGRLWDKANEPQSAAYTLSLKNYKCEKRYFDPFVKIVASRGFLRTLRN